MSDTRGMSVVLDGKAIDALARYRKALAAFEAVGHEGEKGAELFLASERAAEDLGRLVAALSPATVDI